MNILIVANHYAVCSARYATAAFERLGHSVRHVGPARGGDIWGLTLPSEYEWEPQDEGPTVQDVAIIMDSDPKVLDDAVTLAEYMPVIVWGVDNHVRDYRRGWFDHYFLAHRHVSVMVWYSDPNDYEARHKDMSWLPCCYDPTLHTPSPIPFEDREYDVCMIGVMYERRWALVKALKAAGLSVLAGCGLVYENYVAAYHNARIALNISVKGDVAQRLFETAAMGNVVMTDVCRDFPLLKPEGFWTLDTGTEPEAVVQACKDILHEPEHAQNMVKLSQAWAKDHTWDSRAAQIVRWYDGRK